MTKNRCPAYPHHSIRPLIAHTTIQKLSHPCPLIQQLPKRAPAHMISTKTTVIVDRMVATNDKLKRRALKINVINDVGFKMPNTMPIVLPKSLTATTGSPSVSYKKTSLIRTTKILATKNTDFMRNTTENVTVVPPSRHYAPISRLPSPFLPGVHPLLQKTPQAIP